MTPGLGLAVARWADTLLDRSVVLGYSRLGPALRRTLPTWPADPPPGALSGKRVAVTGATSGLGARTAHELARLGAQVELLVRDEAKGGDVAAEIGRTCGRADAAGIWRCDVGDLDSVRSFAAGYRSSGHRLDGLIHNAGVLPASRTESAQKHELTMAVHVLGPVAMTELLLPVLRDRHARVVFVTSGGMYARKLPVDDPEYRHERYSGPRAYARSKRTQVDLLPAMQDRWAPQGIAVYATHPGWAATPGLSTSIPRFATLTAPILRAPSDGADTTVWLMGTDPRPPGGGLWHDRRPRPTDYLPVTHSDQAARARLWQWVLSSIT